MRRRVVNKPVVYDLEAEDDMPDSTVRIRAIVPPGAPNKESELLPGNVLKENAETRAETMVPRSDVPRSTVPTFLEDPMTFLFNFQFPTGSDEEKIRFAKILSERQKAGLMSPEEATRMSIAVDSYLALRKQRKGILGLATVTTKSIFPETAKNVPTSTTAPSLDFATNLAELQNFTSTKTVLENLAENLEILKRKVEPAKIQGVDTIITRMQTAINSVK